EWFSGRRHEPQQTNVKTGARKHHAAALETLQTYKEKGLRKIVEVTWEQNEEGQEDCKGQYITYRSLPPHSQTSSTVPLLRKRYDSFLEL
ncbi:hypothetical protein U0070_024971, partial [Myodes glareolus]